MKDEYINPKETPITLIMVIANIVTFVVLEFLGDTTDGTFMLNYGAMNPRAILATGEWYRLFTATFLHFGIEHLVNNMLLLFFLGQIFEKAVGVTRFLGIYLGSGLAGSFLSFFFMCLFGRNDIVAGASGAIFGIIGGMIVVILVHRGKYHGISTKRMIFMALLTLYFGFTTVGVDNAGHIGGMVFGFVVTFFVYGIPVLMASRHVDFNNEKNYTLDNNDSDEGR